MGELTKDVGNGTNFTQMWKGKESPLETMCHVDAGRGRGTVRGVLELTFSFSYSKPRLLIVRDLEQRDEPQEENKTHMTSKLEHSLKVCSIFFTPRFLFFDPTFLT